jgi:hypothetical protein
LKPVEETKKGAGEQEKVESKVILADGTTERSIVKLSS